MPSTSVRPSTRTRRWARASAWPQRLRMAVVRTYRRCGS